MGDLTSTEDMILTARGFGEGLILVAQRPTISSFILANAGTKVVFRSPYDATRVGEFMGLSEAQENAVKSLRKFEAVVTTVQGGPYKVLTAKPLQPRARAAIHSLQRRHRGQQQPTLRPAQASSLPAASLATTIKATEQVDETDLEDGRGQYLHHNGDDAYGCASGFDDAAIHDSNSGEGTVVVDVNDAKKLLKRKGSLGKFKLFRNIASSPQSWISVSDAIREIFDGEEWKYRDALRSHTDAAIWRKPLVVKESATLRLTEYGEQVWRVIIQRGGGGVGREGSCCSSGRLG